jgi:CheY-like chemotaxis protein
MAFTALVVCADAEAVHGLSRILKDMDIGVENCGDPPAAAVRLSEQRFDVLVVDCKDEAAATRLISRARTTIDNRAVVVIALLDAKNNESKVTASGASFVLYKPISAERSASSLQAARSLIRYERRQSQRLPVDVETSMAYAAIENVTARLVDISEEGVALQSHSKLPLHGKVYFQFVLPGQTSSIRLSGEVLRQDALGRTGIRFVDVPKTSRRSLTEWMQANPSRQPEVTVSFAAASQQAVHPLQENLAAGLGLMSSSTAERRGPSRQSCTIGAEVYRMGSGVPNRCTLSDISTGGCYVETREPFPAGTELEIVVRAQETKLHIHGKVRSTHPGFGTGVQFTLGNEDQRQQVQQLLACQVAGPKMFA